MLSHDKRMLGVAVITLMFALLAGCSQGSVPQTNSLTPTVHTKHNVKSTGQVLATSSCQPCATFSNGPSTEYIFDPTGSKNPTRTLNNGIAAPWVGLAFDSTGDLFVANCTTCVTGQSGVNNVVEIPPHKSTPSVTITNGITYPFDLVIDSSGTLYASNLGCYSPSCYGSVSEYPQGYTSGSPSATIQVKYPLGMALDSHGNLYVANCAVCSSGQTGSDSILVYAPGQTTPFKAITSGINEPVSLAIDASDDLYVANCMNCGLGAAAYVSGSDSITEYSSTGYNPTKTINFSVTDVPFSIAVDPSEDLFVANYAVNSVTEYPPNSTNPSRTITQGISYPASIAVASNGELFVSNAGANTVTGYVANDKKGKPSKTFSVQYPSSIALSQAK